VVWEGDAVELGVDVLDEVVVGELVDFCGVGDACFEVVVDFELEGGVEVGLSDEDKVVVFGEVFEQKTEFS